MELQQDLIALIGIQELVVVGVGVKGAGLIGVDLLADQSQADLLLILHDALAGIVQGLDERLVDTTGGVVDERVALELGLLEDLGIILQSLLGRLDLIYPLGPLSKLLILLRQLLDFLWCWRMLG